MGHCLLHWAYMQTHVNHDPRSLGPTTECPPCSFCGRLVDVLASPHVFWEDPEQPISSPHSFLYNMGVLAYTDTQCLPDYDHIFANYWIFLWLNKYMLLGAHCLFWLDSVKVTVLYLGLGKRLGLQRKDFFFRIYPKMTRARGSNIGCPGTSGLCWAEILL